MKRKFAVGGATLAMLFAIALSFGASSAEAQLLCRVKSRCFTPVKRSCAPKFQLRTSCCKPAKTCCSTPAPKCCATPAPTCCATPAPKCCETPAPTCCESTCCGSQGVVAKLVAKLKSRSNCCSTGCDSCSTGCSSCGTTAGCSSCEATPAKEMEKTIPPAPEATKDAKPTT